MKTYVKTDKLKDVTFRGQKALVKEALDGFSSPKSVEEIEKAANESGRYTKMLNEWARDNGGIHSSILYHLREMEKQGVVKSAGEADQPKMEKKAAKPAKKKAAPRKKTPKPITDAPDQPVPSSQDELDPLIEEDLAGDDDDLPDDEEAV